MTDVLDRSTPATGQPPAFGRLFGRLVLGGVLAGAVAGGYSLLVTERAIRPALDLEESRAAAGHDHGHGHEEELFSRGEQLVGGFLGTVLAGVVLAVVFAAVYGALRHRLPGRTDFARVVLLAAIGFGALALLPALKIPANPPAVGDPGTIGERTAIYAGVLLCGVLIALLVSALVSYLRSTGAGIPTTAVAATVAGGVLLALVLTLVPDNPDAIAADVPAAIVWDFRIASLGQLAVLWAGLGLAGGWLVERLAGRVAAG
jgi:predicted cobalt transporter CbtA